MDIIKYDETIYREKIDKIVHTIRRAGYRVFRDGEVNYKYIHIKTKEMKWYHLSWYFKIDIGNNRLICEETYYDNNEYQKKIIKFCEELERKTGLKIVIYV